MSVKLHYVKISDTLFQLINDGKMNFIIVPVQSKFKLSDTIWLLEMSSAESIPTGSIIITEVVNEVYLDNHQYLTKGWKILGLLITQREIDRTDCINIVLNDEMMKF
jgi:hypothetical protein